MALVIATGAISLCGAGCKTDYAEAQRLLALQQFSEALRTIDHCIQLEPTNLPALVLKSNLLYLLARDQEGIAVLEEVSSILLRVRCSKVAAPRCGGLPA